ncbi:MAG TPA: tRNA-intron lyase [Methanothermococcus okinawensis]|uniref:tRNA-splicing endonuclease n=1 Tax=Methanothermococcus okinawensis TaxID=155863 RepID=A0A832ZZH1_9EURY|nr:tRNA-intron lyase [Methanothermococcus okinawensis]
MAKKPVVGILSGDRIVVFDKDGMSRLSAKRYGELNENFLSLSLIEGLYLLSKNWLKVKHKDRFLSFEELYNYAKEIDERICIKYLVYRDLKNRGYTVKTGLKYGADFRLYSRENIDEVHSEYLVKVFSEDRPCLISELTGFVRVAHSVRKKLIIAIVDNDGDIVYYNMAYIRP